MAKLAYMSGLRVVIKNAAIPDLTAATGTASLTIADVTATPTQTLINNNFKSVATQLNLITVALRSAGTILP